MGRFRTSHSGGLWSFWLRPCWMLLACLAISQSFAQSCYQWGPDDPAPTVWANSPAGALQDYVDYCNSLSPPDGCNGACTYATSSCVWTVTGTPVFAPNYYPDVMLCSGCASFTGGVNGSSGSMSLNIAVRTNPALAGGSCPGYFVRPQPVPQAQCRTCNGVSEPINPAVGNVFETENDVVLPGPGALSFQRFYNSAGTGSADLSPGWRHSYSRSVKATSNSTPYLAFPVNTAVSGQYATPATACVTGFSEIQSQVAAWQGASTSWSGSACVVQNAAGATIGTLQVLSAVQGTTSAGALAEIDATRDDGQLIRFPVINGVLTPPPGQSFQVQQTGSGFTLTDPNDTVETYNTNGVLQSVTTRAGVVQTMAYDSQGRLSTITDSFGNELTLGYNSASELVSVTPSGEPAVRYGYDSKPRLSTVTNADSSSRTYVYENSTFPNYLTGVIDETSTRFSTWGYNAQGQATSAQEAGGADAATLVYNSSTSVTETDALGAVRTFTYSRVGDVNNVTSISGSQCPTCQESAATTYDSAGFVNSRTDYNGNLTCYANDPVRGVELVRVEGFDAGSACPANLASYVPAAGTSQRKISTAWSTSYHLPTLITETTRTTGFGYDTSGNLLTKTITDTTVSPNVSRTWTYTYDGFGRVLTAQGPRTDLNSTRTYTYYTCTSGSQCGQVQTVTDELGHVTTFNTYNAYGQPLTITDPNNVVTTLTYDARQHLKSRSVGGEMTTFDYYPTGLLQKVTLADGSYQKYIYDGAHRLTTIQDGLGDSVQFTLDAMGNRTVESTYDPSNTLSTTRSRVINTLNQLYQDVAAAGTAAVSTTYGYDNNGNLTSVSGPALAQHGRCLRRAQSPEADHRSGKWHHWRFL
jgi:YD repeat-containing protein